MRKKRWLLVGAWLVGTLALSALTSWWVLRLRGHDHAHGHSHSHAEPEAAFHEWMHRNLGLTAEQHEAMAPQEEAFEVERLRLRAEIKEAGLALALQVRESAEFGGETRAALARLSEAQRRLQEATIEHFFQMKTHLNAKQRELLRRWTHDSLLHDHDHHD